MDETISVLSAGLASGQVEQRLAAAETLCRLGGAGRGAAVALVRAAGDADESVRELAVGALEEIGAPQEGDVAKLAALLADGQADVAYWAATLLGRLGIDGAAAVSALAAAIDPSRPAIVRQRAAWALGEIGPAAQAALEALKAAASSDDARLARLAQAALASLAS